MRHFSIFEPDAYPPQNLIVVQKKPKSDTLGDFVQLEYCSTSVYIAFGEVLLDWKAIGVPGITPCVYKTVWFLRKR